MRQSGGRIKADDARVSSFTMTKITFGYSLNKAT